MSSTVGLKTEYCGASCGIISGVPRAVLTFRPIQNDFRSTNLHLSRAAVERMIEDLKVLLEHSPLQDADPATVNLMELEAMAQSDYRTR